MKRLLHDTLLMKSGERDQAWLRVLISVTGLLVIWILSKFNEIPLSSSAISIYFSYILISSLILIRFLFQTSEHKTWRATALVTDTTALTLLACWYHQYPIVLLAIFALPLLGYGLCCGQKSLYLSILISLTISELIFLFQPQLVTLASIVTPVGLIFVVSFFAYFLDAWSRELRLATEEAENAKKSRSIFFANMSHELRTPLHGILGLSSLLNETKLGKSEKRYFAQISDAAKTMLSLVDNVLDFSRIEENKFVLGHTLTDLHKLLFKIYRMFFYQAKKKGLILRFHIDPWLHYKVVCDEKHIQQVLINLVANAIKYTDSGFVALHMQRGSKQKIRFEVLDSGRGIPEDQKDLIFDRFNQGKDRCNSEAGTGLGLTISKQIVEAMGGTIGVRSQTTRNKGSIFWFEVPCRQCIEQEVNCLREGKLLVLRESGQPSRIENVATNYGATVNVTTSAADINAANASNEYHVIILDQEYINLHHCPAASFSVYEAPTIVVQDTIAKSELEHIRDCSGSYYRISPIINETVILNLLHRAIVCKMDYEQNSRVNDKSQSLPDSMKTILIAEDNEINREVISQILRRAGYKIILAHNGEDALSYLKAQKFDLFIVDSQMPIKNGLETIRLFKKLSPKSLMPIIVLSADVSATSREKYLLEGAHQYLCKPVDAETLLETIEGIIKRYPNNSQAMTSSDSLSNVEICMDLDDLCYAVKEQGISSVVTSDRFLDYKTFDQIFIVQIIRVSNSVEYALSISTRCLTQARNSIKIFSRHYDNDKAQAAKEIHYIKGALSSIGANRMTMLCGILDKKEKLELINNKEYIIKLLWKEYSLLKEAIEEWFDSTINTKNYSIN